MTEPTMTPDERAEKFLMARFGRYQTWANAEVLGDSISEAERAAADREREGCAKTALKYMATYPKTARASICALSHIAAATAKAIRARKEGE